MMQRFWQSQEVTKAFSVVLYKTIDTVIKKKLQYVTVKSFRLPNKMV